MSPERARWLLDNPIPAFRTDATTAEVRAGIAPYWHTTDDGWRQLTCIDL